MYADFTDYQGAYCGTLITTQGQWMPAVREACAYLDLSLIHISEPTRH